MNEASNSNQFIDHSINDRDFPKQGSVKNDNENDNDLDFDT